MFSTINDFIGIQTSQNKAILGVPRGARFMIGLNTSKSGNHNLSKMTLAHRSTRHARAAPLDIRMALAICILRTIKNQLGQIVCLCFLSKTSGKDVQGILCIPQAKLKPSGGALRIQEPFSSYLAMIGGITNG